MKKNSQKNMKKTSWNQNVKGKVRRLLKDWDVKIMSYVMAVVILVAVIAATVAWFFFYRTVIASRIGITTAECDSLKVEINQSVEEESSPHFVELSEGEEDSVLVDLEMPVFANVEQYEVTVGGTEEPVSQKTVSKMAPGVYGAITIRLTPLNQEINRYRLKPSALFRYTDGAEDTVLDSGEVEAIEGKKRLQALAKGHILFFANRQEIPENNNGQITIGTETKAITEYTHNQKYVFYNPMNIEANMEGELVWNSEAGKGVSSTVTIYWYWPYEYDNLAASMKQSLRLPLTEEELDTILTDENRLQFFDKEKMEEIVTNHISWNETQLYDFADTRIGTDVESIQVHVKVDGYHVT